MKRNAFNSLGGGREAINCLDDFHRALLEAVDEGFLALGVSVRQALYWRLENRFSIKRDEIPNKPKEFAEALKNIFGAGTEILLKIIIKRFYKKLNLTFKDVEDWSFIDYVENAKKSIKEV
jgi:hypothetical protein